VVLAYTVGETEVRESPWIEGSTVLTRTVEVGPAAHPLKMLVCELPGAGTTRVVVGITIAIEQVRREWKPPPRLAKSRRVLRVHDDVFVIVRERSPVLPADPMFPHYGRDECVAPAD